MRWPGTPDAARPLALCFFRNQRSINASDATYTAIVSASCEDFVRGCGQKDVLGGQSAWLRRLRAQSRTRRIQSGGSISWLSRSKAERAAALTRGKARLSSRSW